MSINENGMHRFVYRDSQKFSNTLRFTKGKSFKRILAYLYCIKYNEINICHLGIQKYNSHEKWFKSYKYFLYRLAQNF